MTNREKLAERVRGALRVEHIRAELVDAICDLIEQVRGEEHERKLLDVWDAFAAGVSESRKNPTATKEQVEKAAEAYGRMLQTCGGERFRDEHPELWAALSDAAGDGEEGTVPLADHLFKTPARGYVNCRECDRPMQEHPSDTE